MYSHENRVWGRIRVSQELMLRAENDLNHVFNAVAVDVSEENIGLETEALLSLGEYIQLEFESGSKLIVVQAVVKRIFNNVYGCTFTEEDSKNFGNCY